MDSKLKIPPEIIDGSDTPEEYHFSNPGPTAPAFRPCWPKSRQEKWPSVAPRTYPDWVEIHR